MVRRDHSHCRSCGRILSGPGRWSATSLLERCRTVLTVEVISALQTSQTYLTPPSPPRAAVFLRMTPMVMVCAGANGRGCLHLQETSWVGYARDPIPPLLIYSSPPESSEDDGVGVELCA